MREQSINGSFAHRFGRERLFEALSRAGFFSAPGGRWRSSPKRLSDYIDFLFEGVPLEGKRLLDVGSGNGIYSFYAACSGASQVVALEPSQTGSESSAMATFKYLKKALSECRVELKTTTIEAAILGDAGFDVVLLHNSVNHLDEAACKVLHKDEGAQNTYKSIFQKIFRVASDGAHIIIADCSRRNLFASLHMKNPLTPMIEWEKHQAPRLWAELLAQVGFTRPKIRWTAPPILGAVGQRLLGNEFMAYFHYSHFCLTMQKPALRMAMATKSSGATSGA